MSVPGATARAMPVVEAYPDAPASKGIGMLADTVAEIVLRRGGSLSEISGDDGRDSG
jgi:hypothetical protein